VGVHAICGTQYSNASQQYEMTKNKRDFGTKALRRDGTYPGNPEAPAVAALSGPLWYTGREGFMKGILVDARACDAAVFTTW
jgi:hypothetical protein